MADSSNLQFINQTFVQEYSRMGKIDQASIVIDNLVKGKPVSPKGKLLPTVM